MTIEHNMSRLTISVADDGVAALTLYGVSGQSICFTGPLIDLMPMFDELAQAMKPEGPDADIEDLSDLLDYDEDDGEALASAGFGTDEDYGGPMQ